LSGNNQSYYLENMLLRVYNSKRYLKPLESMIVTQIEDVNIGCNAESIEDAVASPKLLIMSR